LPRLVRSSRHCSVDGPQFHLVDEVSLVSCYLWCLTSRKAVSQQKLHTRNYTHSKCPVASQPVLFGLTAASAV
jgi:hypothetical protein